MKVKTDCSRGQEKNVAAAFITDTCSFSPAPGPGKCGARKPLLSTKKALIQGSSFCALCQDQNHRNQEISEYTAETDLLGNATCFGSQKGDGVQLRGYVMSLGGLRRRSCKACSSPRTDGRSQPQEKCWESQCHVRRGPLVGTPGVLTLG